MRFPKLLVLGTFILLSLVGCATGFKEPQKAWTFSVSKDEFTDTTFKVVSTGSYYMGKSVYTENGKLYPFVGEHDGKLVVGVRSGGTYRVPVGNIQLRIDENPAWDITTSETPTDLYTKTGSASAYPMAGMMQGAMSPFTCATGEKAQAILKQMLAGHVLKYRSVGYYSQPGVSGQFNLDSSFRESLVRAGIKLPE